MQDAGTVLEVLRERGRKGLPCDELYRQMFNKSLYLLFVDRTTRRHQRKVGWPGGIAPPGSRRSVRNSLPLHGSCHPDHQE